MEKFHSRYFINAPIKSTRNNVCLYVTIADMRRTRNFEVIGVADKSNAFGIVIL